MAIQVRFGGAWRTITGAQVYAGGSWHQLVAAQVYDGGAWRKVGNFVPPAPGGGGGGALGLSLSATVIGGRSHGSTITTNSVTVTPSGGLAPYTYAWSVTGSDGIASSYAVDEPTFATTTATATGAVPGNTDTCTIHCVVTDSLGATATSDAVTATFTSF